jgi:hypothetical protein
MPTGRLGVGTPTGRPSLSLQMIRDYRECRKKSGWTYLRHRVWYWSNRDNPEFWAEWERRLLKSETEGTAESLRAELEHR